MATNSSTQRLNWVDTAKGISILLVVMMHSALGVGEATGQPGVLHYVIGFATPFRMPEFFLISGLFLSMVIARPWRNYADRRVVHYLYFYALWAVLQIVVKVALGQGAPGAALSYIVWATVQPYGVLWFIYMLAVFSAVTKLLWYMRVPHWVAFGAAALLQIAPISAPSYVVTQFAEYFVFFYAGYAFAPRIFAFIERVEAHVVPAIAGLAVWALINGLLVFSPGSNIGPVHMDIGLAGLPGMRLALALSGSIAVCALAALISRLPVMDWLRWLGERSIVVYLAFAIPMAVTREVLVRLDLVADTGVLSILVMAVALIAPLILFGMIKWTGWGQFLFARPQWAHLPGTPGSRQEHRKPVTVPAE